MNMKFYQSFKEKKTINCSMVNNSDFSIEHTNFKQLPCDILENSSSKHHIDLEMREGESLMNMINNNYDNLLDSFHSLISNSFYSL